MKLLVKQIEGLDVIFFVGDDGFRLEICKMMKGTFSAHPWHSYNDFELSYEAILCRVGEKLLIKVIQRTMKQREEGMEESVKNWMSENDGLNWENFEGSIDLSEAKIISEVN